MESKIVDPHTNKPIQAPPTQPRGVPAITLGEYKFPIRILDRKSMREEKINPFEAFITLSEEVIDRNTLVLMGMLALAEDIYSRDAKAPAGEPTVGDLRAPTKSFLQFCKSLGLKVMDLDGKAIDFAEQLSKI